MFFLLMGGNPRCDRLLPYNHRFIRALVLHNRGTLFLYSLGSPVLYPYSLLVTQSSVSLRGGI
jgi:hypothetical protein